jgi:hypothetical protein
MVESEVMLGAHSTAVFVRKRRIRSVGLAVRVGKKLLARFWQENLKARDY